MRKVALSTGLLLAVGLCVLPKIVCQRPAMAGGAPMISGFAAGEFMPPFDVVDVTGPNKGRTLCYR